MIFLSSLSKNEDENIQRKTFIERHDTTPTANIDGKNELQNVKPRSRNIEEEDLDRIWILIDPWLFYSVKTICLDNLIQINVQIVITKAAFGSLGMTLEGLEFQLLDFTTTTSLLHIKYNIEMKTSD